MLSIPLSPFAVSCLLFLHSVNLLLFLLVLISHVFITLFQQGGIRKGPMMEVLCLTKECVHSLLRIQAPLLAHPSLVSSIPSSILPLLPPLVIELESQTAKKKRMRISTAFLTFLHHCYSLSLLNSVLSSLLQRVFMCCNCCSLSGVPPSCSVGNTILLRLPPTTLPAFP